MSHVRKVFGKHYQSIFGPEDLQSYSTAARMYALGIFAVIASFPMSFYFSRQMAKDRSRAGQLLTSNMIMSSSCMVFFAFNIYRMGRLEEKLANKYLFSLTD